MLTGLGRLTGERMTATIQEDRQELEFNSAWSVCKWDVAPEFTDSLVSAMSGVAGTGVKGADVVGAKTKRPKAVVIAEFKDFTNPAIPAHARAQAAEKAESATLANDLVKKIIDTLTGATFSHDKTSTRKSALVAWRTALARPTTKLLVLVCIEVSKPALVNMLELKLRSRLQWLGPNATILVTTAATPLEGLGISYRI